MIDSLKRMFDTIRKECDFKTVEDYNKFMELGIDFLEKFKEADDYELDMIIELQEKVERYEKALEEIKIMNFDNVYNAPIIADKVLRPHLYSNKQK